ncbi:HEPN domain-containing protein, partial [Halomonas sp. BC04]|uniref:HEPN domain-containing protein n=1 Tax=Halomonas sp. BC04 TaxID=1403540 RepID=UPI0018CC1A87
GLGHITRSGVLMLCAAWELYIEEVLLEGVDYFTHQLDSPKGLPKPVQKEIARSVKEAKHDLKPLELAGEGWKDLYRNHVTDCIKGLNTPKSTNLDPLFKKFIGVNEVSSWWSLGKKTINDFVTSRGDIAHKGRDAHYVTIIKLKEYRRQVKKTALDVDNELTEYLCQATPGVERPWRRRLEN